jgi:hypothetical protein
MGSRLTHSTVSPRWMRTMFEGASAATDPTTNVEATAAS